jgi:PBSX family phage terminase large subunit
MASLRLTKGIIEKACELRAYGGSDGACARHAGVPVQTFARWMHYGQMLQDYVDNQNRFEPVEVYRLWLKEATKIQEKLRRELEQTGGVLTKEHRAYLRLWLSMMKVTDSLVQECHITIDRAKNQDPNWAMRVLRWFHPEEYREPAEIASDNQKELQSAAPDIPSLRVDMIAPLFVDVYDDIHAGNHTEYVLFGGRGSTKSSFTSIVIIDLLLRNPHSHALLMRQVANTLRDSVYNQMIWAINEWGLEDKFKCTTSPLEITYLPTGQKIYFRGADDPGKIKSIKPPFGYISILWFEELDQFHGEEAIRKIEQSVMRGGDSIFEFKTFNPPRTVNNWVNKYTLIPKESQYQHKSTYLDLGGRAVRWLGKAFLDEAEHLKQVNPLAYEHEYLGVSNGTGGVIFENVKVRKIGIEEFDQFDRILMGVDWGYFPDPFAWLKCHYDAARHKLYLLDELKVLKAGNRETHNILVTEKQVRPDELIIADSAEPKSIADYLEYGLMCRGAEKGPESLKYSIKWLQSLTEIVIDPERTPFALEEFVGYEFEQDKDDNFISAYPDKNNHFIDAARYSTNLIWRRRGQ